MSIKRMILSVVMLLQASGVVADIPPSLNVAATLPEVTGKLTGVIPVGPEKDALAGRIGEPLLVSTNLTVRAAGSDIFTRNVQGVVKVLTNDGQGSGVVISESGLILTNWHVVEGYSKVGIVFYPSSSSQRKVETIFTATVMKLDGVADLALLKLVEPPPGLFALRSAADLPSVGTDVHAIGHPNGEDWSYTRGYVSQIRPRYEWTYSDGSQHEAEVIQTQTPINPGNSGGPLFNSEGALIGINSFGQSEAQGLNFAVSVNEIRSFIQRQKTRDPVVVQESGSEPRVLRVVDIDKDGRPDGQVLDISGDGKADAIAVDENGDGETESLYVDDNNNGKFEFWIVENPDGGLLTYYDLNEDGNAESIGIDKNGDGVDESIQPIR